MVVKSWNRAIASSILALGTLIAGAASADEFPNKPLRLVTPYPPGGSHSLHAGIVTTVAEPHFGQPMISIIRAGGGGVVGAAEVFKSKPDGYTILFGDPNINSLRPQVEKLPFKTDDFIGVARLNYSPWVFVASPNAPFEPTLKAMGEWAKKNPEKLVYSSDNLNGPTFIVFEMLKHMTGTKMKGIDFGGGGPAITNLLGGTTMAYAGALSVVGEHIKAGKLKGVCVTDYERWHALPDVPTCKETGMDIIYHFWRGMLVPKGTPPAVIKRLSDGFAELVKDKGFLRLIGKINSAVAFLDHEEFGKLLAAEQKSLKDLYEVLNKGK